MNQVLIAAGVANVMPQARATGLFRSSATVLAPSGNLTAGGSPDGTYVNVTGLSGIPCMDAPSAVDRFTIESEEQRGTGQTASTEWRHVLLNDYFADLSPDLNWGDIGWKCNVDGVVYDIDAAESDSQRTQTRLSLRGTKV